MIRIEILFDRQSTKNLKSGALLIKSKVGYSLPNPPGGLS